MNPLIVAFLWSVADLVGYVRWVRIKSFPDFLGLDTGSTKRTYRGSYRRQVLFPDCWEAVPELALEYIDPPERIALDSIQQTKDNQAAFAAVARLIRNQAVDEIQTFHANINRVLFLESMRAKCSTAIPKEKLKKGVVYLGYSSVMLKAKWDGEFFRNGTNSLPHPAEIFDRGYRGPVFIPYVEEKE